MKIMIACGGTGGHLFPGLAVAETLMARQHQVRLLVSEKAVDQSALGALTANSEPSRFAVRSIPAVGYGGARHWMRFCSGLAKATRECAALCREFKPDAVLGMGGFTSAPAVLAGRWSNGTRTLIHESNAVPGKANRWTGRMADHIAVGLAECAKFFGTKPVTVTGTPIREALRKGRVPDARTRLGLKANRVTVLVMGGSQGAHAINEAVACALPWLEDWKDEAQFVHLSGPRDENFVRESYEKNGLNAKVMSFCSEMELAYSAADLVVSRSGAATLTEIAAFGLPAVLIPYPQAAGDHQLHNARFLEQAGAARVIEQSLLTNGHALAGERLGEVIGGLLSDAGQRVKMTAAARKLAVTDAHERIATLIEQYAD
jgi:UDP-N-acetylglucosamine--N-acetylmuramyl-(pentapeptide) pyrophosphoryl-undecaprenol N-acetylglucosamine transferase